jgi:hypothetical protein
MWSASSSTLTSTSPRWQWPCSMRSARRPGQATTMSARLRSAITYARCGVPPKIVATVTPHGPGQRQEDRLDLGCQLTRWHQYQAARAPRHRVPPVSLATSGSEKPASCPPLSERARGCRAQPARRAAWRPGSDVVPSLARTATRGPGRRAQGGIGGTRTGVRPPPLPARAGLPRGDNGFFSRQSSQEIVS